MMIGLDCGGTKIEAIALVAGRRDAGAPAHPHAPE